MPIRKPFPLIFLAVTLLLAVVTLAMGLRLSRQETKVKQDQDHSALTKFTGTFLNELRELESLYDSHLLNIKALYKADRSVVALSSRCRDIVGIEQVCLMRRDEDPELIDLRTEGRSRSLPRPYLLGEEIPANPGIRIPWLQIGNSDDFKWILQPGEPPHFVSAVSDSELLVIRTQREQTQGAVESTFKDWIEEAFQPVNAAGIFANVSNAYQPALIPGQQVLSEATFILPVTSPLGVWRIEAQDVVETRVHYDPQGVTGTLFLFSLLLLVAFIGYAQLRNAFQLAEQRVSFVNRVSHELRTPLTNILLNLDLIPEDSKNARATTLIREETRRLGRLIENVLTFSRRPREVKLALVPCRLEAVVNETLGTFSRSLDRLGIKVRWQEPESPCHVLASRDDLMQIIGNLINNVEKYASEGQKLNLSVESNETMCTLIIEDAGPGIPSRKAQRIFQPFVRLQQATNEGVSGTGLGLTIARDLAEAMNGSLQLVFSHKHQGARFELSLPKASENIIPMAS